mmetsp:Transcript_34242/g.91404  ORF Transcript_34242/g.91404 Transcript_34242/m.91404 type:complete len:428 (+) Transcript_34242:2-1285(+)
MESRPACPSSQMETWHLLSFSCKGARDVQTPKEKNRSVASPGLRNGASVRCITMCCTHTWNTAVNGLPNLALVMRENASFTLRASALCKELAECPLDTVIACIPALKSSFADKRAVRGVVETGETSQLAVCGTPYLLVGFNPPALESTERHHALPFPKARDRVRHLLALGDIVGKRARLTLCARTSNEELAEAPLHSIFTSVPALCSKLANQQAVWALSEARDTPTLVVHRTYVLSVETCRRAFRHQARHAVSAYCASQFAIVMREWASLALGARSFREELAQSSLDALLGGVLALCPRFAHHGPLREVKAGHAPKLVVHSTTFLHVLVHATFHQREWRKSTCTALAAQCTLRSQRTLPRDALTNLALVVSEDAGLTARAGALPEEFAESPLHTVSICVFALGPWHTNEGAVGRRLEAHCASKFPVH